MDILSDLFTRPIIAHTHLPGILHFLSMKGSEGLSKLYSFDVELVAKTNSLDCRQALGQSMSLQIETHYKIPRFIHGVITKFELIGREMVNSKYFIYKATISPLLWYATKNKEYKIFQNKTAPEIIQEVLSEYQMDIEFELLSTYRNWEYCVQYDETDFNFVSRLMEHEGMYYWFRFIQGKHTLVITDRNASHEFYLGYETFTYFDENKMVASDEEYVSKWEVSTEITSSGYSSNEYDFRKSGAVIETLSFIPPEEAVRQTEVYDWMGGYVEAEQGDNYSLMRCEELNVSRDTIRGETNIRGVKPGRIFTLRNHPRRKENDDYLCLSAQYEMRVAGYSTGTEQEDKFYVKFKAIPFKVQYRKKRETPSPKTYGPQTAKVVGPKGEVIWTDKFGRVKVQFHWDRVGQRDENSSCWIRVSSAWASSGYGGLNLPRIGDEVIVDFINGNPDRPIIIGRVYNDANMPLVNLPEDAHTSGFRTRSVKGDPSQENHLLMIDKLGQELMDLRAQYDMVINVINNLTATVGGHLSTTVGGDENRYVKGKRTTTVDKHETETFNAGVTSKITAAGLDDEIKGGVKRKVDGGNEYELTGDNKETIIGNDNYTVTKKQTVEVKLPVTHTYCNTWTQIVTDAVRQNYGSAKNEIVAGQVTETFSDGHQKTVTGNITTSASGTTVHTSGGDYTIAQKDNKIELKGGNEITITAPSEIIFSSPKVKVLGSLKKSDEGGMKNDFYAFSISGRIGEVKCVLAWALNAYRIKLDYNLIKGDFSVMTRKKDVMADDEKLTKIEKVAAAFKRQGIDLESDTIKLIV